MARRGKTDKVGTTVTEDEEQAEAGEKKEKDFKDSPVEGKKSDEDRPITGEDVITILRKKGYRI